MDKAFLLGVFLVGMGCFLMGMFLSYMLLRNDVDLYKQGQIDALNGKWKYTKVMSASPVYVEIQTKKVVNE